MTFAAAGALAQTGGQGGRGGNEGGGRDNGGGARTGPGELVVGAENCLRAGGAVTVTGPLGTPPGDGVGVMTGGTILELTPRVWSDGWVQLTVPPSVLPADTDLDVYALRNGIPVARIGRVGTCASAGGAAGGGTSAGGGGGGGTPPVSGGPVATGPDGRPEFVAAVPGDAADTAAAALARIGVRLIRRRVLSSLGEAVLVFALPPGVPAGEARAALAAAVPGAAVDPHNLYGLAAGPRVYARTMVGAPDGGCILAGPVRVGLIDGPVDTAHPALAGLRVRVRSFLYPGAHPAPATHGTAVAALIAGSPAAGPLAGFAPGAELHAAAVFGEGRDGAEASVELIATGLDWLAGERVRLANLSFAGPWNRALARIISAAELRGMVLVAAAGNDGTEAAALPAGAPGVIAVTAVDAARRLYSRANRGEHIAFAAPGVDLWTARPGGGGYASGTSFAAPIVTAFAARLIAREPALGAGAVRARLQARTVDLGPPGRDPEFGWGLVLAPDC